MSRKRDKQRKFMASIHVNLLQLNQMWIQNSPVGSIKYRKAFNSSVNFPSETAGDYQVIKLTRKYNKRIIFLHSKSQSTEKKLIVK